MNRFVKWALIALAVVLVVLGGVAFALQRWVGSDDFRARIAQQVSAAAGVPVQLGGISVALWPLPAVALDQVQVQSKPPLTLERIEARPVWAGLLRGRLEISTLIVRNAVVPELAVTAIGAAFQKKNAGKKPEAGRGSMSFLPRRTVLDHVTWVQAKGGRDTVDAQATLDDDGLPASARIAVTEGKFAGARAAVDRDGDHWAVKIDVAGGTIAGKVRLATAGKGAALLDGQLDTANVEISTLTAPSRTLTGRLEAHTTLRAEFKDAGALADALQTQTKFTVHKAVVHGIDLEKAVKSVGMNRSGETHLDTLAGNVATQGRTVHVTNLVATSGVLSANGNVTMSPDKALKGRVTVDLASAAVGGAIGVPLEVGGTLDSPSVSLSRGALLGAAVGTVLAPGVGTGAGASLGDKLGAGLKGLFGK
ncbi:AsmA family protein [Caenimonas aquaedulcis]|uniref:AsmA family protein n=1 Tax=Caenimonas aquaedulcis TaxID=2793270 RepID=A0A931MHG0_9BURK|nr:AsmA family protein [Caenimonas aquaedulcis]MBG9389041.1 AsmA family protein [Caenimonas aquaedulcis]